MIGRIIGSGRDIAGMVAYISHDQTSPDERRPTTSERGGLDARAGLTGLGFRVLLVWAVDRCPTRIQGTTGAGSTS